MLFILPSALPSIAGCSCPVIATGTMDFHGVCEGVAGSFFMTRNFKTALISGASMLAAGCLPAVSQPARAESVRPVVSRVSATVIGTINFAAAAASKSNEDAFAALAHAKPIAARPRLLPNGREARGVMPRLSSLPHVTPNTAVQGRGRLASVSGFTGIYEGANSEATGSELEPPDQGMAVNGGVVGEIVNNTIQFFKSGQALTAPLNNATFFNSGSVAQLSDPHITFDPSVKRWFVDELTYSGPLGYGFFLAVSQTSDPTGAYKVYFIPSASSDLKGCGKSGCLPDYPQVGYDANGFYITADLFGSRKFVGAGVYALAKNDLVSGVAVTPIRFVFPDFVVQPAVPAPGEPFNLNNGGTEFFMSARNIYNGSTTIRVWQIQNTFNIVSDPSSLLAVHKDMKGEAYTGTVPSTQPHIIGPYGKSQHATSSPMLDGGYNAFSANVKMASGRLYAALTTGAADSNGLAVDTIAYFVVSTKGMEPRIVKQGYIVPPTGYSISYPGLAIDRHGNGFIGVSITNPDRKLPGGYPSAAVIPFASASGPGTITVTGQGGATDDGFTGYGSPHSPGQVGRWGDFASASIDAETGIYYTANEMIPDPSVYPRGVFANWGTYITAIQQ